MSVFTEAAAALISLHNAHVRGSRSAQAEAEGEARVALEAAGILESPGP